jgi:hypothetical protein
VASHADAGRAPSEQADLSADRLFAELDQRHIMGDPHGSTIEVISIHVTQRAGTWVQMEVAAEARESVLLHLPHSTTVEQAIAALNAWGQTARERRPRCIEVAPQVVPFEWAADPRRI